MSKFISWVKSLMFEEVPRDVIIEPPTETPIPEENEKLLTQLKTLKNNPVLYNALKTNNVINSYLLELYCIDLDNLLLDKNMEHNARLVVISVGKFFSGYEHNLEKILKRIEARLIENSYNNKQLNDVRNILNMFSFYFSTEE